MFKNLLKLFLIPILYFIFLPKPIHAKNVFGLHLTQTSDINSAHSIINSSGGDWGWATIVIRTDQLDKNIWQEFFDNCRKYHIIPIVRIATTMKNNYWEKPSTIDIDNLSYFLNSLNWPNKLQHVTLFNEINHGQEWGGEVDIKNFVDIAIYTVDKLKSLNPNFFILTPGLDLAAPEKPPRYRNFQSVYEEIKKYKPEYFEKFDGLATHYYPQNSKKDFHYELKYFKKDIPVFIKETGWTHKKPYTKQAAAAHTFNIIKKYSTIANVVAITPFIYNYPNPPFEYFSWLDKNEKLFPEYNIIVDEPKNKNQIEQITSYKLEKYHLPIFMLVGHEYNGQIYLKNTGQSIWGETHFCLKPKASDNITLEPICTENTIVYPNQTKIFSFKFKINSKNIYKKSYLAWENIDNIEINPLTSNSFIYRPKTNFWNKILQYIKIATRIFN